EEHASLAGDKSMDFFAALFPVEYVFSVNELAASQYKRKPQKIEKIVVFADPHGDLPAASQNAVWLERMHGENIRLKTFVNKSASLENFKKEINSSDIIILSTHGLYDANNPLRSCIVFSDAELTLGEIFNDLVITNNPLVMLCACESGVTRIGNEDGAGGISGALLSAGAACVLSSHWPVEDISMGYITEEFIQNLLNHQITPSEALYNAIQNTRKLDKAAIVGRCQELLTYMSDKNQASASQGATLKLHKFKMKIEKSDNPVPFDQFNIWGGLTINGCGWHI
ncbi:MAG TPA: CHAT domain-containing protein, partial [Puia sp.]|nr:CHAT domain-containing protein [Puia sp.]